MVKKALYINGPTEVAPNAVQNQYLQRDGADSEYEWTNPVLQAHERLNPTAAQTEFDLIQNPLDGYTVQMFINGIKQEYDAEYTVDDDGYVDYVGPLTLATSDAVEFFYQYIEAPGSIDDLEMWWDPESSAATTATNSPTIFTSIPNRGQYGGTFRSFGTEFPTVAHVESGGKLRRVAKFDSTNDLQTSTLPASNWSKSHQEWTWATAVKVDLDASINSFIVSSRTNTTGNRGMFFGIDHTNERAWIKIDNGTDIVISRGSSNGSIPLGEMVVIVVSYSDAAGYSIRVNGVPDVTGALSNPTDSGDPQYTMNVGALPNGGSVFNGDICEVLGYSRVLEADEITKLETYLAAKWQRQAIPGQYAPTIWLRSDLGIERRSNTDGYVEVWRDLSGNAHDASQSTEDDQPTWTARDSELSRPSIDNDDTSFGISEGAGWAGGTDHSLIVAINPDTAYSTYDYLLDSETGRLIFAIQATPAGQIGFYDGSWNACGAGTTGAQVLEWHLDGDGNVGNIYRDGVFIGSATYAGGVSIDGTTSLLSRYDSSTSFYDGKLSELIYRDSLIEASDLYALRNYLNSRYEFTQTPLAVPDHVSWIDPDDASEFVTTGSYTGTELLTNGDFESGNPPTGWTNVSDGTLSSQPGARTGGSGSQVMRLALTAPDNIAYAKPIVDVLVIGTRYLVTGWFRVSNAACSAQIKDGGSVLLSSTSSTTWVEFSVEFTATNTELRLYTYEGGVPASLNAEWDDVSLVELEPVSIAQDKSRDLATVLTNGDFEDGYNDWTAISGAVLSTEPGSPGGVGSEYLQVTTEVGNSWGAGRPDEALVAGTRYRIAGWRKGDNVNGSPRLNDGITTFIAWGVTSTWTPFNVVYTPEGTELNLSISGNVGTEDSVGFDDITCVPSNDCYQETEANRPVLFDGYLGFTIDNEQYMEWVVPNASAGTIWGWIWVDDLSAGAQSLCGSYDGTDRCAVSVLATGLVEFGLGTVYNSSSGSVTEGAWHFIACTWEAGAHKIYINNSAAETFAETTTASPEALYVGARNWNGAINRYLGGRIGDFGILDRVATADEIEAIRQSTLRS